MPKIWQVVDFQKGFEMVKRTEATFWPSKWSGVVSLNIHYFNRSGAIKSESTYGRIIFCKNWSISLLLTDLLTFKFPAGLTTEKYVLKHCNGLPLHGPTEIYLFWLLWKLHGFWWRKSMLMADLDIADTIFTSPKLL